MKIVNLIPMGLLSVILFACTNETDQLNSIYNKSDTYFKKLGNSAGNGANPYDGIGQSYRNALLLYKAGVHTPDNYEDIVLLVHYLLGSMPPITGTATITQQQLLAACMTTPDIALEQVLQSPSLSEPAVTILSDFFDNFSHWASEPFGKAYSDIIAIENTTLNSATLSDDEQRIILAVTSITRYSLHHSCCEDTDWGKSVGNIIAALAGALESNQAAVEYPLITSIAGLEKIQL
ncbi:hypothetical protein OGH69_14565 [Flavobacterium sp. MFBS3-15]|uniref:hypothetical protein n=1 Tax=Flavobacterium sp. MFBS3-15 TaxID=2989816 RepID=UPI0022362CCE|nr:hypothetical protein [Flavobacterium sp. MFBS3-15]MCW4470198.1 hypothetical protein [Flavobacterium sp. MFBS3-15]